MNYATQHHIGNYQHTRTATTTAITPTVRRVRPLVTKAKRCKPGAERQTEIRTHSNATNGILKCTFLPKLKTAQSVQACKKTAKTERDFYQSLYKLAEHYSIEPMQTKHFGFPYNIALSMWDMEAKVKRTNIYWEEIRLVQDSEKTFLTSEERFDTGTTLYYIPIVPLYQMLHDKMRKKNAKLLVSVCSYLYHIADIPYYRQEKSYLYWLYEMHQDWAEDEENQELKRELKQAELIGNIIEQKLFSRHNLTFFKQRLNGFISRDTFDHQCWQIACNAFTLYTKYPKATIFRNAPLPEQDPYNDDYENEIIGMEKYISFIADTKGWLYENIESCINNEFNECGIMEEPTICKAFDDSEISQTNLDFESRLFALLNDLSYVLNNYKTT
ncbi:hypothetical protein [Chryseobacterium shandongense]|uniref:hypothetical protein n=1 Tax=Chryseobacterium shandongense TaxID=1493872 RepID=UPI000F510E63|nr:hypothetical protein [Chryseobacterium shandongense]AZA56476.1 hypothetical protein EG350_04475 [Chryseobacterium shandongense]